MGVAVAGGFVLGAAWLARRYGVAVLDADLGTTIARVRALRYGRLGFVGLYALGSAFGVPVTPLTLAGGAVFGAGQGLLLNWTGEMLGASLAFALGRLAGPTLRGVLRRGEGNSSDGSVDATLRGGGLALLRLRVIPVVPFALLNYGAALSGVRWPAFLAATAVGIVPVTLVYTLFASSMAAGVTGAGRRALLTAAVAGLGVILLSFAPALARRVRARQGTPRRQTGPRA